MSQRQPDSLDAEMLLTHAWIKSGHRTSGWYAIHVTVIGENSLSSVSTMPNKILADHWLMEQIQATWETGWHTISYIAAGVFKVETDGGFQLLAVMNTITTTPRPEFATPLEEMDYNMRIAQENKP